MEDKGISTMPSSSSSFLFPTVSSSTGEERRRRRRRRDGDHDEAAALRLSTPHHSNQRSDLNHSDPEEPDPSPIPSTTANLDSLAVMNGTVIRYCECLRNHAATIGGHVVDGCGEFMPSADDGTAAALICAACSCHRSFHRREAAGESPAPRLTTYYPRSSNNSPNRNDNRITATVARRTPPPPPQPPHYYHHPLSHAHAPPVMVAFGVGAAADSSSEDLTAAAPHLAAAAAAKKRHRTKFSKEQKGKMMEFAEKVEWRIQKQDEQQVEEFCSEVGVKRQVLKVWMHNNKKKQA